VPASDTARAGLPGPVPRGRGPRSRHAGAVRGRTLRALSERRRRRQAESGWCRQIGHRFCHRRPDIDNPIEAGRVEESQHRRSVTHHLDRSPLITHAPDSTDQCAQTGRIHERHSAQVDHQSIRSAERAETLAEVSDGESVQFPDRSEKGAPFDLRDFKFEHHDLPEDEDRTHPHHDGARVSGATAARTTVPAVQRVLVATDSDQTFDEVSAALAGPETTVSRRCNGREVRSAVIELEPDLIVLDLQIGSMGGVATCMDLRLEESGDRLERQSILLLLDRDADVFIADQSGADGWIIKPTDAGRLRRAAEAIGRGESFAEVGRTATTIA
jgi:CheY-like chemotaxis protein